MCDIGWYPSRRRKEPLTQALARIQSRSVTKEERKTHREDQYSQEIIGSLKVLGKVRGGSTTRHDLYLLKCNRGCGAHVVRKRTWIEKRVSNPSETSKVFCPKCEKASN